MKIFSKRTKHQKRFIFGIRAFVWIDKAWSLVDGVFNSAYDAQEFIGRRYAPGIKFRTETLRFSCIPMTDSQQKGTA